MFILWIRKSDKNKKAKDLNVPKNMQSHNDQMKLFHDAHPDLNIVQSKDILTPSGDLLAPIHTVKLSPNSGN